MPDLPNTPPGGPLTPGDNGAAGKGTPASLTAEDVSRIANDVFGHRIKHFAEKQLPGVFADSFRASFAEVLPTLQAAAAPPADAGKPAGKGKPNDQQDPALVETQQQLAKLQQKYEVAETARKAERQKARDKDARAAIVAELMSPQGPYRLDPARADVLAEHLYKRGVVKYADEDSEVLNAYPTDPEGIPSPLKEGLGQWAKTDTGKAWAAPVAPAGGSGARRAGAPPSGGNGAAPRDFTNDEIAAALAAEGIS